MTRITIGPPGSILDWDNWGSVATNLLNEYDDRISGLELEQGAIGTPATTAAASTTFPNTGVETRDAVMGNYIFTAVAGRRYRVVVDGAKGQPNAANTTFAIKIRNGGASTPTTASPIIAETSFVGVISGGPGQGGLPALANLFTPGAGTQTLSVFGQVAAGTGSANLIASRSLYVEDMGAV